MKKTLITLSMLLLTLSVMADDVMRKEADGTYVVNTTTLCNARGYKSTTPLEVYIKGNKVVKVIPLKNQESPGYFRRVVEKMFPKFEGIKTSKVESVDVVTGATLSSKVVIKNVKAAVKYYKDNK